MGAGTEPIIAGCIGTGDDEEAVDPDEDEMADELRIDSLGTLPDGLELNERPSHSAVSIGNESRFSASIELLYSLLYGRIHAIYDKSG